MLLDQVVVTEGTLTSTVYGDRAYNGMGEVPVSNDCATLCEGSGATTNGSERASMAPSQALTTVNRYSYAADTVRSGLTVSRT